MAIAEKYKPVLQKLAKENMLATQNNNQGSALQKSSKQNDPIHTRDELAKIAGVSHDTYGKAKKILDYEKEKEDKKEELSEKEKKIIDEVKTGEKKVNTGFNELFDKPKQKCYIT